MRHNRYTLLILIGFLLASCKQPTIEEFTQANQDRAEPIIEAIYQYEEDHALFPETLNDLVPTYLEELPSTTIGEAFFYLARDVEDFSLSFSMRLGERRGYGCGYTDRWRSWDCGYGD